MKRTDIKRRPLADTTLSSLEPEAGAYRELDSPGLYFRVKPNGQKSWELRYKKPDGKWSWLGLGGYPEVGGAFARQKAADLRADASEGKNPITSKKARQASEIDAANDTFEAMAREWHTSRLSGWDAGTAKRILGALERHVFPSLGKRPYTHVNGDEAKAAAFSAVGFALDEEWNAATEQLLAVGARILAVSHQRGGMGNALSELNVPRFGPFHSRLERSDLAAVARSISLEDLLAA